MTAHTNSDAVTLPPVLELDGLSVRLAGRPVLDDLHATVGKSAIGLLGPNGAGKTTLLRTILGFFRPSGGSARVLGRPLTTDAAVIRQSIGYMPENEAHVSNLTAVRFVRMMGELSGLPPEAALERAHEALFFVGLGEARYRRVGTFSTGMKQMVKLAQALVHGPELLMLDEPTNGLDPPARARMLELVREIRDRGETRILLSSHLLQDVEAVCDEVLILKKGRVAATCDLAAERRANRQFVEIELTAPSETLAGELATSGCEVATTDSRRFKVVLPADSGSRQVMEAVARCSAAIRRLDCKRDSLQDIFLRAMEAGNGSV
jgi:ABC-2 type transport system ATP-binding protein